MTQSIGFAAARKASPRRSICEIEPVSLEEVRGLVFCEENGAVCLADGRCRRRCEREVALMVAREECVDAYNDEPRVRVFGKSFDVVGIGGWVWSTPSVY